VRATFSLIFCFLSIQTCIAFKNTPFDSIIERGKQLENRKDFINALNWYKEALYKGLRIDEDAQVLERIAGVYYNLKKYRKSNTYYRKAITRDTTDTFLVKNYIGLSYNYKKLKIQDSTLYFIKKAKIINGKTHTSYFKADANYKIGFILKSYGLNDEALLLFLKAYNGLKKYKEYEKLANVCNAIGLIHRLEGNSSASLVYYHKGKSIRKSINDSKGLAFSYNNLGNSHKSIKQLDSALYYYHKAFELKNSHQLKNKGTTLHNIGTIYYMKSDNKRAKKSYQKALKAKKAEKKMNALSYTYLELALIAIEENDLNLGVVYLDSSRHDIKGINELSLRWFELQKKIAYKTSNFREAYEYQNRYIELYKNLYNHQKSDAIINSQEKFDTNKKTAKIITLTQVNQATQKTLNKRTIYLITVFILLLLVSTAYYVNNQKQKLKVQKEDNKNLRELFKNQDVVRNKIGRDLHDIVKSKYEGIRLMITSLSNSDDLNNHVQEITKEISDANEQVRTLSHRLSPLDQRISHSSLNQIIRSEFNKLQLYTNIQITITSEFPEIWNQMILESKNHLYAIILESINNIRDHSSATEVIITSSKSENISELTIMDNGIGSGVKFNEGIGIGNMKSRAKLMNGELKIIKSINGFKVIIRFPIDKNIEHEI